MRTPQFTEKEARAMILEICANKKIKYPQNVSDLSATNAEFYLDEIAKLTSFVENAAMAEEGRVENDLVLRARGEPDIYFASCTAVLDVAYADMITLLQAHPFACRQNNYTPDGSDLKGFLLQLDKLRDKSPLIFSMDDDEEALVSKILKHEDVVVPYLLDLKFASWKYIVASYSEYPFPTSVEKTKKTIVCAEAWLARIDQ